MTTPDLPPPDQARTYFCNKCGFTGPTDHALDGSSNCHYRAIAFGPFWGAQTALKYGDARAAAAVLAERERNAAIAGSMGRDTQGRGNRQRPQRRQQDRPRHPHRTEGATDMTKIDDLKALADDLLCAAVDEVDSARQKFEDAIEQYAAERVAEARKPLNFDQLQGVMSAHFGPLELTDDEKDSAEEFARAIERAHGIGERQNG